LTWGRRGPFERAPTGKAGAGWRWRSLDRLWVVLMALTAFLGEEENAVKIAQIGATCQKQKITQTGV